MVLVVEPRLVSDFLIEGFVDDVWLAGLLLLCLLLSPQLLQVELLILALLDQAVLNPSSLIHASRTNDHLSALFVDRRYLSHGFSLLGDDALPDDLLVLSILVLVLDQPLFYFGLISLVRLAGVVLWPIWHSGVGGLTGRLIEQRLGLLPILMAFLSHPDDLLFLLLDLKQLSVPHDLLLCFVQLAQCKQPFTYLKSSLRPLRF